MIEVTYTGKNTLTRASRFLLTFFPRLRKKVMEIAEEVMEETRIALVSAITNKDRSKFIKRLRSISPGWVAQKKAKGWRLHQLAATDAYAKSIHVRTGRNEVALRVQETQYPGRKFNYTDLARFLEYGTKNMEPLPHWRKASKYFREEFKKRLEKEVKHVRFGG